MAMPTQEQISAVLGEIQDPELHRGLNDLNMVRNANGAFTAQSNNGIFTYPSQSPFGMNGRFVYTRVTYTF